MRSGGETSWLTAAAGTSARGAEGAPDRTAPPAEAAPASSVTASASVAHRANFEAAITRHPPSPAIRPTIGDLPRGCQGVVAPARRALPARAQPEDGARRLQRLEKCPRQESNLCPRFRNASPQFGKHLQAQSSPQIDGCVRQRRTFGGGGGGSAVAADRLLSAPALSPAKDEALQPSTTHDREVVTQDR